jgi:hypothetical protein
MENNSTLNLQKDFQYRDRVVHVLTYDRRLRGLQSGIVCISPSNYHINLITSSFIR